jgi:hypothetical protein
VAGRIMSMKKSNYTNKNNTRDTPGCSAVPELTASSRATDRSKNIIKRTRNTGRITYFWFSPNHSKYLILLNLMSKVTIRIFADITKIFMVTRNSTVTKVNLETIAKDKTSNHTNIGNFITLYALCIILQYTGLFISPSGISEVDCATTKTDTAERSISIGRESLQVSFVLGALAYL